MFVFCVFMCVLVCMCLFNYLFVHWRRTSYTRRTSSRNFCLAFLLNYFVFSTFTTSSLSLFLSSTTLLLQKYFLIFSDSYPQLPGVPVTRSVPSHHKQLCYFDIMNSTEDIKSCHHVSRVLHSITVGKSMIAVLPLISGTVFIVLHCSSSSRSPCLPKRGHQPGSVYLGLMCVVDLFCFFNISFSALEGSVHFTSLTILLTWFSGYIVDTQNF